MLHMLRSWSSVMLETYQVAQGLWSLTMVDTMYILILGGDLNVFNYPKVGE